jgi:cysteinyl-tRNA synthetase
VKQVLKIYNTLTRQVEEFVPLTPNEVKIYVCGPTVYNYFHIGNARPFVVFDAFRNYLKYRDYKVTFVQNVTDVDDKIINKARDEGTTWDVVAKKYTDAYFEDIKRLKIEKPDVSPKATEEIDGMIELVKKLVENGHAYVSGHGVYFSVEKSDGYGMLSHKHIDELKEGARVDVDEQKNSPLDFALWKFAKPGEPSWASPWGPGRPGWHIECSAMSGKYLGDEFDIHCGGNDLIFPHHENELAQSRAAGKKFARYWMHNGFMNIKGEKMSKSTGNTVLAREVLDMYPAEVVRIFLLSAHYHGPIDFTKEAIDAVKAGYRELYYTLQRLAQADKKTGTSGEDYIHEFKESLDNDFNTPQAIAVIYNAVNRAKNELNKGVASGDLETQIREMCDVLKITPPVDAKNPEVTGLAKQVDALRKDKKYAEADAIKKQIADIGYLLEFSKSGTFVIKELK